MAITSNSLISVNPFNQEVNGTINFDSPSQITIKLNALVYGQKEWGILDIYQRANFLLQLALKLEEKRDSLALLITSEMGKPISQSIAEIDKCAACCRYYAENSEAFLHSEEVLRKGGLKGKVHFQPLGVVLALMPWNFPFWQVFRCAVPALMAGNTIALKLANNTPLCALAIQDLFAETGFPQSCLKALMVDIPTIEALIKAPQIAAISLTGSEKAGRAVASIAGSELKKCVLELGGSDPFLVFADADLEWAAEAAAQSRLLNTGQSCIAAKRFIVHYSIIGDFVDLWDQALQKRKWGNPLYPETDYACLAGTVQASNFRNLISEGIKAGAKLLRPKNFELNSEDAIVHPNVLAWVGKENPIYHQELFGPIGMLFIAENEKEMLSMANDHPYGLGASVWTKNLELANAIVLQLEAGTIAINDFVKSSFEMPFGGIKKSGFGRELGSYGILEFVNIKSQTY